MKIDLLVTPKLSLIPIQSADQPILYQLMDEVYRDSYRHIWKDQGDWYVDLIYNPETLRKELGRDRSHYFFVEAEDRKIGILKYDFPFSPREIDIPESMKLHRLYLHQDFHGKGIAQILVNHCVEVAKANGLKSIWLEAMECQPQAKRFYEKMGFEVEMTYRLDFEIMLPEYRGIQIMKKSLI
ncbi:MAG: GNAT family N-acetyltransferase [Algoriphagus sp.]|nr:GNAT family N-acetyltransferase [Algoriphagus sp.]